MTPDQVEPPIKPSDFETRMIEVFKRRHNNNLLRCDPQNSLAVSDGFLHERYEITRGYFTGSSDLPKQRITFEVSSDSAGVNDITIKKGDEGFDSLGFSYSQGSLLLQMNRPLETGTDRRHSDTVVLFDADGRLSVIDYELITGPEEWSVLRFENINSSPSLVIEQESHSIRAELSTSDGFATAIFKHDFTDESPIKVPLSTMTASEVIAKLVPRELIDNPQNAPASLDEVWKHSNIPEILGITWK